MDFVNWEFAKDFIGNSLRISLGENWTKIGLFTGLNLDWTLDLSRYIMSIIVQEL